MSFTIVKLIKQCRLRLFGHVALMDNNNVLKRVFEAVPVGARRPGRPVLRFKDSVMSDIKRLTLKIGEWRQIAANRRDWSKTSMVCSGYKSKISITIYNFLPLIGKFY